MRILFFVLGLALLMAANIFFAPKIVRKRFTFSLWALVIFLFYGMTLFFLQRDALYGAILVAFCLSSSGFALLLYKRKQHFPGALTLQNTHLNSDREIHKNKYLAYKHWYQKLIIVNIGALFLVGACLCVL